MRHQGVALFLDYGPEHSAAGDSLQALARKRPVDPLVHAGSADLTAHVDFADLGGVARASGAVVQGPVAQGPFLTALGLFQRTERLARNLHGGAGVGADRGSGAAGGPGGDGASFQGHGGLFSRLPAVAGFSRHLDRRQKKVPPCSLPCS